jgi:hypothetical protein
VPSLRRIAVGASIVVIVISITLAVVGFFLFTRPHVDPLTKADAIVVLGGDKDGRVDFGFETGTAGLCEHCGAVELVRQQ